MGFKDSILFGSGHFSGSSNPSNLNKMVLAKVQSRIYEKYSWVLPKIGVGPPNHPF